ncbi:hypothetical protein AALO_G00037660 [Alosa alosa]|uniref:Uncharacterized protein n=1 Tax=Alosa alosa TaxID=278164 RepID=A0AAV6H6P5_9TELE|nr:hypothetical protein AALO_G00037660 [Alosa alosa]
MLMHNAVTSTLGDVEARFGKKKEEKKEGKTAAIKHTADILSEEELERMKEERERIEAKHQELRDRQAA